MKALIQFLLSLKTAFWLFTVFIVLMFLGSLSLPANLAFFSGIDETPLFTWLKGAGNFGITWWIYALIVMLALLAVSTVFCTFEAVLKRVSRRQFLLKLSPQVMHIGVLFIMLGHLLTASLGIKTDVLIRKGENKAVTGGSIELQDVKVWKDQNGYDQDWEAKLRWSDGATVRETDLRPARPRYVGAYGLYIKSVSLEPDVTALVRVCRDPGALWALLGGFLLSAGGIGFIYGRFSAE